MAYIVPSSLETLLDQTLYTRGRLVDVACDACTATVEVRKNSDHHTSIQWTREAVAQCRTFAELDGSSNGRPVHAGCPFLVAAIERAVDEGAVTVGLGVDP